MMTKEYEPNLERSLHFYKTHAAVPSNRKSVMITESWNFNTSHGTSLNNNKSKKIMTEKERGLKPRFFPERASAVGVFFKSMCMYCSAP